MRRIKDSYIALGFWIATGIIWLIVMLTGEEGIRMAGCSGDRRDRVRKSPRNLRTQQQQAESGK